MPFLNKIMTGQTIKNFKKWAFDQKGAVLLVRAKVSICNSAFAQGLNRPGFLGGLLL
jgi:hypothetical protein